MPEEEPDYQPPATAPASDTPPDANAQTPEQQLAYERGRADALAAALERQPQPGVTPPPPAEYEIPIPATPLEMLTANERESLRLLRLQDAEAYEAQMLALGSRHAQLVMARQAGGIITTGARSIVDSFRARMSYEDAAYFKDVAPLFDAAINALGKGIQGLINMSPAQQDQELAMRWKSAKVGVMEKQQADAARKAKLEPPPLRGDGLNAPNTGPTKVEEIDPVVASLHARYNFTPEQLAAINGAPA